MDDFLKERGQLAGCRIREIARAPEFFAPEEAGYWKNAAELYLETASPGVEKTCINEGGRVKWLDFGFCRRQFGTSLGNLLCILYAQLWLAFYGSRISDIFADAEKENDPSGEEFRCVLAELLIEIYLMHRDGAAAESVRDTLYWFYFDYTPLFAKKDADLIRAASSCGCPERIVFGGPMLFWDKAGIERIRFLPQHANDFSIYIGPRFINRFLEAYKKVRETGNIHQQVNAGLLPGTSKTAGGIAIKEYHMALLRGLKDKMNDVMMKDLKIN